MTEIIGKITKRKKTRRYNLSSQIHVAYSLSLTDITRKTGYPDSQET